MNHEMNTCVKLSIHKKINFICKSKNKAKSSLALFDIQFVNVNVYLANVFLI